MGLIINCIEIFNPTAADMEVYLDGHDDWRWRHTRAVFHTGNDSRKVLTFHAHYQRYSSKSLRIFRRWLFIHKTCRLPVIINFDDTVRMRRTRQCNSLLKDDANFFLRILWLIYPWTQNIKQSADFNWTFKTIIPLCLVSLWRFYFTFQTAMLMKTGNCRKRTIKGISGK